jgi:DNA-binding NarL/FixJ family response regulator
MRLGDRIAMLSRVKPGEMSKGVAPVTGTRSRGSSRKAAHPSWRSRLLAEQDQAENGLHRRSAHTSCVEREPVEAVGRTVVIADDDLLLREGIASLLTQAGYSVVGQAGDATELVGLVREHRPDVAIVDIRMPPDHATEGLRAAQAIRDEMPEIAILVLSAYVEVKHATTLLASGQRSGYLLKSRVANIDEFLESIDRLTRGGSVVDPSLVLELLAARTAEDPLENLTPREREVLGLMAEGRTNAGIARRLWVTEGTVEKHVHSIFVKLRLPETGDDHRRVLAAITFLQAC